MGNRSQMKEAQAVYQGEALGDPLEECAAGERHSSRLLRLYLPGRRGQIVLRPRSFVLGLFVLRWTLDERCLPSFTAQSEERPSASGPDGLAEQDRLSVKLTDRGPERH